MMYWGSGLATKRGMWHGVSASSSGSSPEVSALILMKIRAFPDRDKSHKRLKYLADLHALLWYVTDYDTLKSTVQQQITDDDVTAFTSTVNDQLYERTARLIDVDSTIVRQSIEQLFI